MTFLSKQKSSPYSFHEGTKQVHEELARLVGPNVPAFDVVLRKITIYKTPLQQLSNSSNLVASSSSFGVYHHFLIVEVSPFRHPVYGGVLGLLIRAEKLGLDPQIRSAGKKDPRRKESVGIKVKIVPYVNELNVAEVHSFIDLLDGLPISLKKLVEILTEPNPHYDLVRDNCWKYADTTYKAVVKHLHRVNRDEDGIEGLANNLRGMPVLVMPIDIIDAALIVFGLLI